MTRALIAALRGFCLAATLLSLPALAAPAEKRIALVIGNGAYDTLLELNNPVSDMRLLAGTLRSLDFEVIEAADQDRASLQAAIQRYGDQLKAAGPDTVGFFFYAGHGFQVDGTNYFLPTDARLLTLTDTSLTDNDLKELVSLDWLLERLGDAGNRLNFVILDACRNNLKSRGLPPASQGLAKVDAPTGTLVAYATAPGEIAGDGASANSPYSRALAEVIATPGLVAEEVFRHVRNRVIDETSGAQVPWESSSLTGAFYFEPTAASPKLVERPVVEPKALELAHWDSIKDQDDPALFKDYLTRFPDGTFVEIARLKVEEAVRATDPAADPTAFDHVVLPVEQLMVTRDLVNVRVAPNDHAEEIAVLARGDQVDVTGKVKNGDWYQIWLEQNAMLGYVKASQLATIETERASPTQLAALPKPVDPPASRPDSAAGLEGRWAGEYRCQQDVIGFTLDLSARAETSLAAVFNFFALPGSPSFPSGSFEMSGDYSIEDGLIALKTERWLDRPFGFQSHDLAGEVDAEGATIEGRILTTGCADFVLRKE